MSWKNIIASWFWLFVASITAMKELWPLAIFAFGCVLLNLANGICEKIEECS
jgi:hypothetical protein